MANITIKLKVNKKEHELLVDEQDTLLDIIRDRLDLTGTKNGCAHGACGACTVIMDGEAVKSCIVKAKKAHGKEITTIEGIAHGFKLHPIQEAFVKAGAVQCGFCTPGFIMALYGLYSKNIDASDEEIKATLDKLICRCTGYEYIWEAAKLAQKMMHDA